MMEFEDKFKDTNITLLNPGYKVIDNVVVIGATLWTNLSNPINMEIVRCMGEVDNRMTHFSAEDWHARHIDEADFIEKTMENDQFKDMHKVVITHYLPTIKSCPERFRRHSNNAGFISHMAHLMHHDRAPVLWLHGHTHDSCEYQEGKTRVIANPYGYYPFEINPEWNSQLLIEVKNYDTTLQT